MKFLDQFSTKEVKFQRFFGLNFKQLDMLIQAIEPVWAKAERERLSRGRRIRNSGAGRLYKLGTMKEKVAVVLLYYKQYLTQELVATIFGVDQSAISRLLQKLLPLIEKAADPELQTYLAQAKESCVKRISNMCDWRAKNSDLNDVSTDATEQQCYRATDYEKQKKYYSGKTKQHAIKTQISVSSTGRILDVSKSYPGSTHDKAIIDQEKTIEKFHENVPHRFDAGYQGIRNEHPKHYLILPVKKPKGKELSALAKEHNKANSKLRVVAEHAIGKIKKFRICATLFRQPLEKYNQTIRNIASLCNFKLRLSASAI